MLSKIALNMLYGRISRYQQFLGRQTLDVLRELKNIHQGERCFIVGTGPSLSISDLEMLKGEVTFGTNRIYELYNQTNWRPTYYINQDYDLIRSYSDKIKVLCHLNWHSFL